MSRLLAAAAAVRERRNLARHPASTRPELLAERPHEVWSWDITKRLGPAKWTNFSLDVGLDSSSRSVVGWLVAHRERAELAQRFIAETAAKQGINPEQLTLPADRGSAMTAKPVALLLADLGITKSHSRPSVSNDNPSSDSQFKTMKYRPEFPERFGSIEDARAFCQPFFRWSNPEHRPSGIGLCTPEMVHTGQAAAVYAARVEVGAAVDAEHPERCVRRAPRPPPPPTAAWIHRPAQSESEELTH